ncbi:hypothetical protein GGX14DRAFT_645067 [Mycena pura]|uniref:Uncharacterized protein n=1 Tax=Mycena pura TaxID=153505 RepID=A0AAD6VBL5_9AGAR|nr:hypothetical protein GGX14DRAFT_645067 [Mycena pura]
MQLSNNVIQVEVIPAVEPLTARGHCHRTNARDPTADQEQAGQQLSFKRRSDHGTRGGDREYGQGGEVARASRAARVRTPCMGGTQPAVAYTTFTWRGPRGLSAVLGGRRRLWAGLGGQRTGRRHATRMVALSDAVLRCAAATRCELRHCATLRRRECGKKDSALNSNGIQCQATIAEWRVGSPEVVSAFLKNRNVSDLLIYVRDFSDVSDFLIFDTFFNHFLDQFVEPPLLDFMMADPISREPIANARGIH